MELLKPFSKFLSVVLLKCRTGIETGDLAAVKIFFAAGALVAPARIAVRRSVRAWDRQVSQAMVMV